MPSIGPSVFILGLVMASAIAQQATTESARNYFPTSTKEFNSTSTSMNTTKMEIDVTVTPSSNTSNSINTTTATSSIVQGTSAASSTAPMNQSLTPEGGTTITTVSPAKPDPSTPSPVTRSSTRKAKVTTAKPNLDEGESTGIIIIIVMALAVLVLGGACYFTRRRARRYSVDLHSRADDAQIPLSTVEPDAPVDTVSQNGMQSFNKVETDTKEPQEPLGKPEGQEEQKAEADTSVPSTDPAALAPSPDSSVDKAKEDIVEPTPAAPVEQSLEEKTDDEVTVSNETSVESLKEPNENNSNNAAKTAARDLKPSSIFSEVPLDSPV